MSSGGSAKLDYAPPLLRGGGGWRRVPWQEELVLLAIYAALVVTLWILTPYFLTGRNITSLLRGVSEIGIVAVAMTLVIVAGGIDLSVGAVVGFAAVLAAQLSHHVPAPLAVATVLAAGAAVGAFNGTAIAALRMNPLIATLATLSIISGLAFALSRGHSQDMGQYSFYFLGRGQILGVPVPVLAMASLFAFGAWAMGWTVFGRSVYAVGGNAQASRLAGIPVRAVQVALYVLCGLSAAAAGVVRMSRLGAAASEPPRGFELNVIAAVVLGGTSLSGGKGTVLGTLLGVLIMGTVDNGLNLLRVPNEYQDIARGTILFLAVGLDQLRLWLARKG